MSTKNKASATPETPHKAPWDETIRTFICAVIIALIFRSFAYEPFHIPSGSMKSNLLIGDYLFVSKYSYGYSRYSFPFGMPLFHGRLLESSPKRGDVVVFRLPSNTHIDYIKRVIGLPGDRIQLKNGVVYLNGAPLPRLQVEDYTESASGYEEGGHCVQPDPLTHVRSIPRYVETLPEDKHFLILKECQHSEKDDTPEYVVPEGHYFMMGDNRDNSRDSRWMEDGVGFVPEENIVGRASIIFFSTDGTAQIWEFWKWFSAARYDRFFRTIE